VAAFFLIALRGEPLALCLAGERLDRHLLRKKLRGRREHDQQIGLIAKALGIGRASVYRVLEGSVEQP